MTKADLENGKVGIFNGDTSIRNIGRVIIRMITSIDTNGNSLAQFGIELKEDGTMSLNADDFNKRMDEDPEKVGVFFSGETTVDENSVATHEDGIFETINAQLLSYTKSDGLLYLLNQGLETEFSSLQEQHEKTLALLDSRYETMTQRFIAYDSIINRLNTQSESLKQQIDMAVAAQQG